VHVQGIVTIAVTTSAAFAVTQAGIGGRVTVDHAAAGLFALR
jgi:hypothetical protein